MLAVVFPLAFALSLPPSDDTSRYQVDFTLHATPAVAHWPISDIGDQFEIGANAQLQLTLFVQPVRNDDAPPSLRPFLQRVASLSVAVGADIGYHNLTSDSPEPTQQSFGGTTVRVSAETYSHRYLYLAASVGYHFEHLWTDEGGFTDIHEPSVALAIGVRFGDVRIAAVGGTTIDVFDDNVVVLPYVGLRAHAVIRRRIELDGGAALLLPVGGEIGESFDASAMFWLSRNAGLGIGGFYRHGALAVLNGENDSEYGGAVTAKLWLQPRTALTIGYSLRFETSVADDSDESRTDHQVTLGLTFRQ